MACINNAQLDFLKAKFLEQPDEEFKCKDFMLIMKEVVHSLIQLII